MKYCITVISGIILLATLLPAQTLSPKHQVMEYLDYFHDRGLIADEFYSQQPFTARQIANMVRHVKDMQPDPIGQEFIKYIEQWLGTIDFTQDSLVITVTGGLRLAGDNQSNADILFNPRLAAWFNRNVSGMATFIIQNEQPGYDGKVYGGMNAYSDQAHLLYENDWATFKLGRDYLKLGPGHHGQLLFADASPAFDQYNAILHRKWLSFSFWGIKLDDRRIPVPSADSVWYQAGYKVYERYINGHRLAIKPLRTLEIGVSEVVIYGGPTSGWELAFMNPLMFYHGHALNKSTNNTNTLFNLDADWQALKQMRVWGELLVDDFQIDYEDPADLEPNEIGFTMGANWADPFSITGTDLTAEFTQVRNRTYNAPKNDWEKYLHDGLPIGYALGNDVQALSLSAGKWWTPAFKTKCGYQLVRKGEGTISGVFDTTFLQHTVADGYMEKIPYGIVETTHSFVLMLDYQLLWHGLIDVSAYLRYDAARNYQHITGNKATELTGGFKLDLDYGHTW
jgi:hypothetical protein